MTDVVHNVVDPYLRSFERFEKSLNGGAETRVHGLRRRALDRFTMLGFPTTKDEEWRFTNVAPITKSSFSPVLKSDARKIRPDEVERFALPALRSHRLVFVDGHFDEGASSIGPLTGGCRIGSLGAALDERETVVPRFLVRYAGLDGDAFTAMNTAFLMDGAFVVVPDGETLDLPIHLIFVASNRTDSFFASPRNLIVTGKNSRASIVESYVALEKNVYFTNAVTEIVAGEGSVIEHDKLQGESDHAFHVGATHIQQHGKSNYVANSISFGGAFIRNTVTAVLDGEHSECTLNGLSLATGKQLVDNHTVIDHAMPNCVSHELYKSILDGQSKGVFNGKIFVRKDAQKTDAKQTNKTLLLSDDATIDTKPQLEIFADDVKCTHGATVGQLDEEQIFYLRSRGVGTDQARDLLTYAFASDVIQRVHVEPLRDQLEGMMQSKLRRGRIEQEQQ